MADEAAPVKESMDDRYQWLWDKAKAAVEASPSPEAVDTALRLLDSWRRQAG
ncbi:MAG: hypothetical protein AB7O68_26475 [Pirellulales bacterium]